MARTPAVRVAALLLCCLSLVSAQNRCARLFEHSTRESSLSIAACQPCPPHLFSFSDFTYTCEQCPPGFGVDSYGLLCEPCAPGFYKPAHGYQRCRPCPPGTYSTPQATACQNCPASLFSTGGGSIASCMFCPVGHHWRTDTENEYPECVRCPLGFTSDGNSTKCRPCPPGFYSRVESDSTQRCAPCPPGTFSQGKTSKCSMCAPGTYSSARAAPACNACPPRSQAWVKGMSFCVPHCGRGTVKQGIPCVWCEKGHGRDGNACAPCSWGTYSSRSTATECAECPFDMVPYKNATACRCAPGLLSTVEWGRVVCNKCIDRHAYSPDGRSCVCTHGMKMDGNGRCRCFPGHKYVNGQCVRCSWKELQSLYRAGNQCESCAPGEGLYDGECTKCPAGTANEAVNVAPCYKCPPGMEVRRGACRCKPGSEQIGPTTCRRCGAGSFSDDVYEDCTECQPGWYSPYPGASACKRCPFWLTSWFGAKNCRRHCPRNSYMVDGRCICTPRFYWDGRRCRLCSHGRLADKTGLKCKCSAGRGWINGRCAPCPAGTFSRGDYCIKCAPGEYSRRGTGWSCHSCPAGMESLQSGASYCTAKCPFGWFKDANGKCTSCPKGTFVDNRKCNNCPQGLVSPGGWSATCVACPSGKKPDKDRGACI